MLSLQARLSLVFPYIDADNVEIGLKENAAYGLVAKDVKTQKNNLKASIQVHHDIEIQRNEAYGQVTRDIITTNEAYGVFQSNTEDSYVTVN